MALLLVSDPARKRSIMAEINCSTNEENCNLMKASLVDGKLINITVKARRLLLVFWQFNLLLLHFFQVDVDKITRDFLTTSGVFFDN